jgi:hypothetical protein
MISAYVCCINTLSNGTPNLVGCLKRFQYFGCLGSGVHTRRSRASDRDTGVKVYIHLLGLVSRPFADRSDTLTLGDHPADPRDPAKHHIEAHTADRWVF